MKNMQNTFFIGMSATEFPALDAKRFAAIHPLFLDLKAREFGHSDYWYSYTVFKSGLELAEFLIERPIMLSNLRLREIWENMRDLDLEYCAALLEGCEYSGSVLASSQEWRDALKIWRLPYYARLNRRNRTAPKNDD